jgi:NADP-dependent 3-hydroxy acid dehydrogenase YdfG
MTRSILITGAGAGIGRATARLFLAEGWEVTLLGRRRDRLEETAGDRPARLLTADVGNPDQVQAAFARLSRLDVLFNNAGISAPAAPIDEIPVETWLELSRTNITGMFL